MSKRLLPALIFVSMLLLAGCNDTSQGQAPGTVLTTPPGVAPPSVYVTSSSTGALAQAQDTITALDASTGKPRWHFAVKGQTQSYLALAQNVVYFGASDGYVYALNARDGKQRWRSRFIVGVAPLVEGVDNGVVYIVLPKDPSDPYNSSGPVLALNASNGKLRWRSAVQGRVDGVTANALYVLSQQTLYALNPANGKILWQFNSDTLPIEFGEVVDGQLYVYSAALFDPNNTDVSRPGFVYALNPSTGALSWRYPAPNVQEPIGYYGIYNGVLYLTSSDQPGASTSDELLALNASDGSLKWRYQQSSLATTSGGIGLAVQNGIVYVGENDGSLYALSEQDGSPRWHSKPESDSFGFTPGDDGGLYASAFNDGRILALSSSDGSTRWQYSETEGSFVGILQIKNGVLYAEVSPGAFSAQRHSFVFALKTSDGSRLWNYDTGIAQIYAQVG